MKKTLRMLLLVLVLCLGLVMPAAAETTDGFASDHICMADMAGVLNEREVTELETMIDEIRTRQKFDIAILTVSEEDIPSVQEYADDIYDGADMGYGETRDGVLLVVDLKSSECYMSTKGYGITVFTDAGIQYVGQQMRPELADGDFAGAFRTFATLCDDFITQARNGQPYDVDTLPKEPLSLIWIPVAIVIGFIIAFVIVGGMKKQLKTVRFQAKADDYVKAGSMNIVDNQEWFLYQNIVKTENRKITISRQAEAVHILRPPAVLMEVAASNSDVQRGKSNEKVSSCSFMRDIGTFIGSLW